MKHAQNKKNPRHETTKKRNVFPLTINAIDEKFLDNVLVDTLSISLARTNNGTS